MKMKPILIFALLFLTSYSGVVLAQDKPEEEEQSYGIFETQDEYFQFMGAVKENPETLPMVNVINDIVLGQELGTTGKEFRSYAGPLGLLADPDVRADLEMLDYQYEELQEKNAEIQRQAAEEIRGLDMSDMQAFAAEIRRIHASTEEQLGQGLLPHQMERLRQLQAQNQLRRRSFVEIITSDPMKSDLEISDEQAEQLREAEAAIEERVRQQIAELRVQAREELMQNLNSSQREQVDEIFGEAFESNTEPPRRRGRK